MHDTENFIPGLNPFCVRIWRQVYGAKDWNMEVEMSMKLVALFVWVLSFKLVRLKGRKVKNEELWPCLNGYVTFENVKIYTIFN